MFIFIVLMQLPGSTCCILTEILQFKNFSLKHRLFISAYLKPLWVFSCLYYDFCSFQFHECVEWRSLFSQQSETSLVISVLSHRMAFNFASCRNEIWYFLFKFFNVVTFSGIVQDENECVIKLTPSVETICAYIFMYSLHSCWFKSVQIPINSNMHIPIFSRTESTVSNC